MGKVSGMEKFCSLAVEVPPPMDLLTPCITHLKHLRFWFPWLTRRIPTADNYRNETLGHALGMGFVDVSRSLLPDKVVFSSYITITFIFIILIFQDCFLRSVRTTSSSIFSLN